MSFAPQLQDVSREPRVFAGLVQLRDHLLLASRLGPRGLKKAELAEGCPAELLERLRQRLELQGLNPACNEVLAVHACLDKEEG